VNKINLLWAHCSGMLCPSSESFISF
jgi:hypothetical protein